MPYISTKNYGTDLGLAVCYRQWRADRRDPNSSGPYKRDEIPTCGALHGYALSFYFEFESQTLDSRNWVVDFGSLRPLKTFLQECFDHTLLVAQDDPQHAELINLHKLGIAKVVEVEATGCEALAKFLFEYVNEIFLPEQYPNHADQTIRCNKVEVRETPSNMAMYYE